MGIKFEPFVSFFSAQRIFNKSIKGSLNKLNITAHCGKISGPEEATSAIVGKGGSLEDVDKTKKKTFPLTDVSEPVIYNNSHEPFPIAILVIAATSSLC